MEDTLLVQNHSLWHFANLCLEDSKGPFPNPHSSYRREEYYLFDVRFSAGYYLGISHEKEEPWSLLGRLSALASSRLSQVPAPLSLGEHSIPTVTGNLNRTVQITQLVDKLAALEPETLRALAGQPAPLIIDITPKEI